MKKRSKRRLEDQRYDLQYNTWRKGVLKRDKYKCQWPSCKKRKGLQIHHIMPWATYPLLRFIIDNGITLCYDHHKSISGKEVFYIQLFNAILCKNKQNS